MKTEQITITSPVLGRCSGFIYCIYITSPRPIVYIGETAAKNGPLGRLSYHMQSNGTFVERCRDYQIDLVQIDEDIHMLAVNLEAYPKYCGDANKTNRHALEYFVNMKMEEYGVSEETTIPFEVVSRTTIATRLALEMSYQNLAEEIAYDFVLQLPFK